MPPPPHDQHKVIVDNCVDRAIDRRFVERSSVGNEIEVRVEWNSKVEGGVHA